MASVRCLIMLLAIGCIAITAFVCTFIAVTSADRALDTTRDASADALRSVNSQATDALSSTREADSQAIDACFSTATSSIMNRTGDMLGTASRLIELNLLDRLDTFRRLADRWYDRLDYDAARVNQNTDAYFQSLDMSIWLDFTNLFQTGLSTMMTVLFEGARSGRTIVVGEDVATLLLPPDADHHLQIQYMYGASHGRRASGTLMAGGGMNTTLDPVWDAPERLADGSYESDQCWANEISPKTGQLCNVLAMRGCRWGRWRETNGVIDDGVCRRSLKPTSGTGVNPLIMILKTMWPVRQARWSPITPDEENVGIGTFTVWSNRNTGQPAGYFMQAIDLRVFGEMLSRIRIGGDESRERTWIMTEDDWMRRMLPFLSFLDQRGGLIAASHGTSAKRDWLPAENRWEDWHARLAYNSDDPIIRAAARHFEDHVNGSYGAVVDVPATSFRVNSSIAGGGWWEWKSGEKDPVTLRARPLNGTVPFLNGRLSASEQSLPPLPGFAADGEEFFATVRRLRSRVSRQPLGRRDSHNGQTEWFLVIVIDREYVLGATDREQEGTRERITANNERVANEVARGRRAVDEKVRRSDEEVQDELDRDRIILYAVVAGSALLLIALSVFFSLRIVAPINELQAEMAQVAKMHLEEVDQGKKLSALQEVALMQQSFLQMVANLKEFRSYMPASVLVSAEDSEEEPDMPAGKAPVEADDVVIAEGQTPRGRDSHGQDPDKVSLRSKRSGDSRSRSVVTQQQVKSAVVLGVSKRSVALLQVNVLDFLVVLKAVGASGLVDVHAKYLAPILDWFKATKGIPDCFTGDRVYASYNAARPTAGCRPAAVKCALLCADTCMVPLNEAARGAGAAVSIGVSGGEVICGNMGLDSMRKYCCIGAAAGLLFLVEQQNRRMQTKVTVDQKVMSDVESSVIVRCTCFASFKGEVKRFWEAMGKRTMAEDEWMYQLEEAAKTDPTRVFSNAVDEYAQGNLKGALEMLQADTNRTPQHAIVEAELTGKLGS
eukprot:TRINITY_DN1992_c0_g1_i2.p1 TRINITY_DN1992_c0_g1~~TRINITY_DN1992_c0_g1_i2.p1  ORF type:complete len:1036 (+),score=208.06 TRINITY_DN1992_c0_g1_i2:91-3108(+)